MQLVFNDPALQKQFEQKGYVIIPSLLQKEEIDKLNQLFKKFESEYVSGPFQTSHFSEDTGHKKEVHQVISEIVFPRAAPFLNCFHPLFGNFMIKNPDPEFAMDLHADWSYVHEPEFCSAAIWIPLIDTTAQNGCLGVIEGSHKIMNTIRGPLIRQSTRDHEAKWAKKYGKLLPMKSGDAIIYNHALLHYSLPNKTNRVRPALNLSIVPEGADWLHYCQPEGKSEIEMYSVPDEDFYIKYSHFQRPQTGALVKTLSPDVIKYIEPKMKWFGLRKLLGKIRN